jgi:hypothetical protein
VNSFESEDAGGDRAWVAPGTAAEAPLVTSSTDSPAPTSTAGRPPPGRLPAPLRPLTVGDIVDGAFLVLKARPGAVLAISAIFTVPVQLLIAWLQRDLVAQLGQFSADPSGFVTSDTSQSVPILESFVVLYLALLPFPFVGAAIARLVASWYSGTDLTAGEAIRESLSQRRWLWLLLSWGAIHLVESLALVACVVPALFAMSFFQVVAPVIALEDVGPVQGVQRAFQLSVRRYWWVVLTVILSILVSSVVSNSLTAIPGALAAAAPSSVAWLLLGAVNSGAALFLTPVLTSISVLLYLDLRMRTEGLDLELRAARVFAPTSA